VDTKIEMDKATIAKFKRTLAEFEAATGKTAEEGMRTIARSCLKRLASTVQPMGLKGGGKMGKFVKSIGMQVDRAWLITNIDGLHPTNNMRDAHYAARKNGVVPRKEVVRPKGTRWLNLISVSERDAYKKIAQKKAFRAKAAWVKIYNDLGKQKMTGVSPLIYRHLNGARGSKTISGQGITTAIKISNETTYINNIQYTKDVAAATAQGLKNGLKWMKTKTDKAIEKANRQLK